MTALPAASPMSSAAPPSAAPPSAIPPSAARRAQRLRWLMAVMAVGVALVSFRFLLLGMETAFPVMLAQIEARPLAFLIHVAASPIALALGAIQFFPRLRARRPALHRWTGRVYGLAILAGGLAGLVMAPTAVGGPVAGLGFGLLALAWLFTTGQAVRLAMARQFDAHRRWMIRSYALTFAAVTLRIYLPFFLGSGVDYPQASVWLAWMCWVPNLLAVEWWMRRRDVQPAARRAMTT